MSEINEQYIDDHINAPVFPLEKGLAINDLIKNHETVLELRADDFEGDSASNFSTAETCFNFKDLESEINLDLIDVDQEDGHDSPFDKFRKKMTNLRGDGKIMKHILKQGVGCTVPKDCVVYIRYKAYLEYQEVPFDSTFMQCNGVGHPSVPFNLGKGQLLVGLHEAILSMKKGEKAEYLIHPDLAYGRMGCPPRIPGEATVLFIIEVDRFVDCGDIYSNTDDLSMEERHQFCNVYKTAKGHYLLGNDFYNKKNYTAAVNKYRQVINMMHNARLANEEEEKTRNHFLIINYTNACMCYHKLKNYKRVCIMAADAVRVNQSEAFQKPKLLYYWGLAKMHLNDFESAKKHLMSAKKLQPTDSLISDALALLTKKTADIERSEKVMMKKAFGFDKPEAPKITEIDEAEETLRNIIQIQLQEFKRNSNTDSLMLKEQLTVAEERMYIKVAKEMGLYARVADGVKRIIHIKKPAEM